MQYIPHGLGQPNDLPPQYEPIDTTWNVEAFKRLLPDFVDRVKFGFALEFGETLPTPGVQMVHDNYPSTPEQDEYTRQDIKHLLEEHPGKPLRILNKEEEKDWNECAIVSPMVVVVKQKFNEQTGKYYTKIRSCLDYALFLNQFMRQVPCKYPTIDDAASAMSENCWMFKADLSEYFTYLNLVRHHRKFCCFRFEGVTYQWQSAGFGISCIPGMAQELTAAITELAKKKFAEAVDPEKARAEAAAGAEPTCLSKTGELVGMIDDFLGVGFASKRDAQCAMNIFHSLLKELGIACAPDKTIGPVQKIEFLGLILDSVKMQISVSDRRMAELKSIVGKLKLSGTTTRKHLMSVAGKLNFAASAIKAARPFIRRLWNELKRRRRLPLRREFPLSEDALLDLAWWKFLAPRFNGVSTIDQSRSKVWMETDSSNFAAGGFIAWNEEAYAKVQEDAGWSDAKRKGFHYLKRWGDNNNVSIWFRKWTKDEQRHITELETRAFMELLQLHKSKLRTKLVVARSDASTTVAAANKGNSASDPVAALSRRIHMTLALNDIAIDMTHIAGVDNLLPDAISRTCLTCEEGLGITDLGGLCHMCASCAPFHSRTRKRKTRPAEEEGTHIQNSRRNRRICASAQEEKKRGHNRRQLSSSAKLLSTAV